MLRNRCRCGERRGGERRGSAVPARMQKSNLPDMGNPTGRAGAGPTLTFRAGGPRLWAGTSYTWEGSVGNEAQAGLGIVTRALGRQRRAKGRRRHCRVHRSRSKLPSHNKGSPTVWRPCPCTPDWRPFAQTSDPGHGRGGPVVAASLPHVGAHSCLRQPHRGSRLKCRFPGPVSVVLGSLSPAGSLGICSFSELPR